MTSVLFVHREDLDRGTRHTLSKEEISFSDLKTDVWRRIIDFDMVIFVDDDKSYKVLKNRFG